MNSYKPRSLLLIILLGFVLFPNCSYGETAPVPDRLVSVGKLWVTVRYFDPYLATAAIDWDKAFCDALPGIREAKTPAEYAAALNRMLGVLHDPATMAVVEKAPEAEAVRMEQRPNGTLIVSAARGEAGAPARDARIRLLVAAMEHASTVVFDLRGSGFLSRMVDEAPVQSELAATELDLPGQRRWVHNGLKPFRDAGPSVFYSAFLVKPGERVSGHAHQANRNVAFLLGDGSRLPAIGAALWMAGKAGVVSETPFVVVDNPQTISIAMGDGVEAFVRLSDAVTAVGRGLPEATVDRSGNVLDAAIAAAHNRAPQQPGRWMATLPTDLPDKAYEDQPYPRTELRILAATKIWGAFHYFFAYKDLMDEDWDDDYAEFLPRLEAAKNVRDYNLAVSQMVVRVDDANATVNSDELTSYFGEAPPPLRLRLIEKKPVVTRVLPEAKAAGIVPGDVVVDVDHNDAVERANNEAKYISASTRAWLGDRVMERLLNGPEGSVATLTIKSAGGQEKQVQLKRSNAYEPELEIARDGDVVRLLAGGIGYADLNRLKQDEVSAMWEKLHDAKAIIFDMRGRAATGAAEIAPRLAKASGLAGAIVNGPLALLPDVPTRENLTETSSYFFVQALPKSPAAAYTGKTVMLVDERTIGAAEHTALFFESANNTTFVGSPSAGALSETTNFVVPGGLVIGLSGRDIRHGNSGQLQRLGIQPSVAVTPTISGIRRGEDEVLAKAVEYVSSE
ncbi:MAG: S41 family peptidase [Bryobacteraceae bacterium]